MPLDRFEERQFDLLGIDQYELHLGRVFLIENGYEDRVQSNRLTLTRCTCHQQVGHFSQVSHEYFIGDVLSESNRKLHFGVGEFLACQNRFHGHHFGLLVGYFNTDGTLARNGGDDPDTQCRKAQRDIIFQVLDL